MDSSDLSRLSPELRNVIYELVFQSPFAVTLQTGTIEHALTKTCRQVRHETLAMYYNLTRFNAHLDDGPATPLATWLRSLGPELTLCIDEINLWDLHNLNGTLHGTESTERLLRQASPVYVLRPIVRWSLDSGLDLTEVVLVLHAMGLDLARFCIVDESCMEGTSGFYPTSDFAVVKLGEDHAVEHSKAADVEVSSQVVEEGNVLRALLRRSVA